jgi:hypothetical protein
MQRQPNSTWAGWGAKYGAILSVVGGAIAMLVFTVLALLKIPVFNRLPVLGGTVLSNVFGASISLVVLAIGGMIVGAILGMFLMALIGIARIFWREDSSEKLPPKFSMHDSVRVRQVPAKCDQSPGFRRPIVGEAGAVVMVYDSPHEAYAVEGVLPDGRTAWLADFTPNQLDPA